jgi:Tol biopolymer transport system component
MSLTARGQQPAGGRIAFSRYKDIYTVDALGGEVKRLTSTEDCGGCFNLQPAWSPDGGRIAFTSNRDGDFDIYVMNAEGGDVERLTDDPGKDSSPAWSPDGEKIAYVNGGDITFAGSVGSSECNAPDIYVIGFDGGRAVKLTDGGVNTDPDWSPDGRRIAFASNRDGDFDIYVMDADGKNVVPLTHDRQADDADPDWSPDGESIAYGSGYRELNYCRMEGIIENPLGPLEAGPGADLYIVGAAGSDPRRLTFDGVNSDPTWFSDGAGLAFTKSQDSNFELFFIRLADLKQTLLAKNPNIDLSPSFGLWYAGEEWQTSR